MTSPMRIKNATKKTFTDEDGEMPDFIPPPAINEYIFNQNTVDRVLEDLMTKGIKVAGGDRLGGKPLSLHKTKSMPSISWIALISCTPHYRGSFARRVVCDDNYAQTLIDDFKIPERNPHIAVSVDMLDTGIDVPEIVNLVFFKRVRSKVKFWQMIGQGTRLCKTYLFGEEKTRPTLSSSITWETLNSSASIKRGCREARYRLCPKPYLPSG